MQRIQVTRHKINFDTGEVKEVRRWVKRRKQFYSGGSGFLVVNNGLAAADELRQLMEWWVAESGHKTADFTLYDDVQTLHAAVDVEQHEWETIRRRAQLRAAAALRRKLDSDA